MSDAINHSSLDERLWNVNEEVKKKVDLMKFQVQTVAQPNQLGVDNTILFFDKINDILKLSIDAFKDGFQARDIFAVPSIIAHAMSLKGIYIKAKKEITDDVLTSNEISEVTSHFVTTALDYFDNIPKTGTGAVGTNNLRKFMAELINMIETVVVALSDGLQWRDRKALGSLSGSAIQIGFLTLPAWAEAQDLTQEEIAIVFSETAGDIWSVFYENKAQ